MTTYLLLESGRAIKCLNCSMVSYSLRDIEERYCGNCHQFHDRPPAHVMDIQSCWSCGCTDSKACIDDEGDPCFWVENDLCSECGLKLWKELLS